MGGEGKEDEERGGEGKVDEEEEGRGGEGRETRNKDRNTERGLVVGDVDRTRAVNMMISPLSRGELPTSSVVEAEAVWVLWVEECEAVGERDGNPVLADTVGLWARKQHHAGGVVRATVVTASPQALLVW